MPQNGRISCMNDEKSSRTGRESDANIREQWLPVSDAATVLSLSPRTVQKQAASGKLPSKMDGRRLLVCLEVREPDANRGQNDANIRDSVREVEEIIEDAGKVDAERMIATLEEEVSFLRSELTANRETHEEEIKRRDIAESELRRLMLSDKNELLELRHKVALLLPPTPNTDSGSQEASRDVDSDEVGKDNPKPKRSLWARIMGKE